MLTSRIGFSTCFATMIRPDFEPCILTWKIAGHNEATVPDDAGSWVSSLELPVWLIRITSLQIDWYPRPVSSESYLCSFDSIGVEWWSERYEKEDRIHERMVLQSDGMFLQMFAFAYAPSGTQSNCARIIKRFGCRSCTFDEATPKVCLVLHT